MAKPTRGSRTTIWLVLACVINVSVSALVPISTCRHPSAKKSVVAGRLDRARGPPIGRRLHEAKVDLGTSDRVDASPNGDSTGLHLALNESSRPDQTSSTSELLRAFARDLHSLSELRPSDPGADFSQEIALVSAGSSYTRAWTTDTWKRHTNSPPHVRYFRHLWRWRYSTTAQKVFPSALFFVAWACFVSIAVKAWPSPSSYFVQASKGASSALGGLSAPLALLLTLRTNAALGRLNEVRLAWGRLVLYARSITALLRTHVLPIHPEAAILAARHVAIFGWLLKSACRGEDRFRELEVMNTILDNDDEYWWLASHPNTMWGTTLRLRQIVAAVAEHERPNDGFLVQHQLLEQSIANMEVVAGVCERILASPIPPTYSRHLSRVLMVWLSILPFGLIGSGVPILGTIFASAFTSYVLVGLDELTMEIEYPFPLLPLQQLAAAVHKGVGMQLIDNEGTGEDISRNKFHEMPQVPLRGR